MILTDTGPLVAIIDPDDRNHARCVELMDHTTELLICPAACLTEAMYLVYRAGGHALQTALWELRRREILTIHEADQGEYDRIAQLMKIYSDSPMDLADAAVVAAAEKLNLDKVFTLDKHFYAYRLITGKALDVLN